NAAPAVSSAPIRYIVAGAIGVVTLVSTEAGAVPQIAKVGHGPAASGVILGVLKPASANSRRQSSAACSGDTSPTAPLRHHSAPLPNTKSQSGFGAGSTARKTPPGASNSRNRTSAGASNC